MLFRRKRTPARSKLWTTSFSGVVTTSPSPIRPASSAALVPAAATATSIGFVGRV